MSRIFKLAVGSCLFAKAAANFVSPGLGKCLDLEAQLKEDGKTRETLEDMMKDERTNVQLYRCHGNHNQHFEIVGGQFRSYSMEDFCLTAEAIEDNANVHLEKCVDGKKQQQWDLTGDGYVKVKDSDKCLDVKAKKKDDDSYEKWDEIKKHKVNNVHLYRCHDPATTTRVNQLWSWVPYQNGKPVTEKTEKLEPEAARLWEISDISLTRSGPVTVSGFAFFAAATMLALGIVVGRRMQRTPQVILGEE
jgi:ribonuclease HI